MSSDLSRTTADSTAAPLEPTLQQLIGPGRLRILVVGKSGTGKSSLLKAIFKLDSLDISNKTAGKADIRTEYKYPDNERLVVHDSQGYEPGNAENYNTIVEFIRERSAMPNPDDRIHVLWICITCPYANGRVLETGTEELLKSCSKNMAVIVVFTKYDLLVTAKKPNIRIANPGIKRDRLDELAGQEADVDFRKLCITPLYNFRARIPCIKVSNKSKYATSHTELVKVTIAAACGGEPSGVNLADKTSPSVPADTSDELVIGRTSALIAVAQRVDIDSKIKLCIEVGRKRYWRGLASSTNLPGVRPKDFLHVIHKDIVMAWNLCDPEALLTRPRFEAEISLISSIVPEEAHTKFADHVQAGETVASAISAMAIPVSPIVLPIAMVVVAFARWVYESYKGIPGVLRNIMRYIVHLTNTMQALFHITGQHSVTEPVIDGTVETYRTSDISNQVGTAIDRFVEVFKVGRRGEKDRVFEELLHLIEKYRFPPETSEAPQSIMGHT
ncbi:hypothetical protein PLICRDRAFT_173456 [Plicaturopsis crispa FD-325 SS-3]|nr:hypothetical protein PLICRDRAFT_173456 [Plicaturopsis crispa FD-325 SS-3]